MDRRGRSHVWAVVVITGVLGVFLTLSAYNGGALADEGKAPLVVAAGGLSIELSPQGEFAGMTWGPDHSRLALAGGTRLAGCKVVGGVGVEPLLGGGLRFTRKVVGTAKGHGATLVESFLPTKDSIRWEIEITGGDMPWSAPIETWLKWPDADTARWWTA